MKEALYQVGIALFLLPSFAWSQEDSGELMPNIPEAFSDVSEGQTSSAPWWDTFGDENLTQIIDEALRGNHDLAGALARVRAAEAQVTRTAAPLWPTLSLDGSLIGQPSESLGFQFGGISALGNSSDIPGMPETETPQMPAVVLSTSAMVNLRYQFDLWGQSTHAYRASQLLGEASRGDSDSVAALLTIQVGMAYFDAVAAQQQIEIIMRQIEINQEILDLLSLRFENNQAAAAEVLQQRQQLASTRSRIPSARAGRRIALQRLNVLMGRAPSSPTMTASTLPELSGAPAVGRPEDLFRNRPDIRAARDRLAAARRQERSARRALLPTLGVAGNAGYQGFNSVEYIDQGTWGFGVTVSFPAFSGFADQAAVREAQANRDAARHSLDQEILQAISDVEAALAAEAEAREQLEAHHVVLEAAQQAFDVSRQSYVAGVGNYLTVLVSLGTLQTAELTLVQAERALINARLQLYQAMGGAWTAGLARSARSGER